MYLKNNTITFSLYFFVTIFLIELMNEPNQAILIWPAVGIGIITALIWGIRVLPALYLAELLISIYISDQTIEGYTLIDFAISNLFITASLFRCYLGAYLIRHFIGYPNSFISHQAILKFFLLVGPLTTLASTFYYDAVNYLLGYIPFVSFTSKFFDWWFGDLLGFIIFAPLTMVLIAQPKSIWKPRYLSFGIPVILIFLSVIIIYNKSYDNEQKRLMEDLNIKSEVLVTKFNESNNWMSEFLNFTYSHFIPKTNNNTNLTDYFNSLTNSELGPNALVWYFKDESDFVKVTKDFDEDKFNQIKTFNFEKLINQYQTSKNTLSNTRYIDELDQFINVLEFKKPDSTLVLIIIHDFTKSLSGLLTNYGLKHVKLDLQIHDRLDYLNIIGSTENIPFKKVEIKKEINFNTESMQLVIIPTAKYFLKNGPELSSILAKIGFLFAGLVGIMLLIITGKTTFIDIKVNERTLELDQQTKDLRARKKQYQLLIEQHPVILWRQDITKKRMSYISEKVVKLYGYTLKEWIHDDDFWLNHIHGEDRPQVVKKIESSILTMSSFELEYRFIKADKSIAWIKDVINITNDRHFNTQLVGLMIDVSETKEAISGQNISESKYRTLFKHAVDPLIIIDLDSKIIKDSNDKAISLFGLNNINGQVSLADFSILTQPDGSNSKNQLTKIFKKLLNTQSINLDWTLYNKAHEKIICNLDIVKLPNQTNNIVLVNINDITEKRQHERKINQLAYYDNLTKLPNRGYFYSKFEYFHERAIQENKYGTIIYLDLDRFKILNDSLGHQAGDILLEMVAKRIRKVTRKNDFCARLGGDEFIILTKKLENTIENTLETTLVKSELILEALNEPYQLGDYEHLITPSIGISYFPMVKVSSDQIIHQADIAMYASKNKGKNTITIYQDSMVKKVNERLKIEKAVRQALDNDEFKLHYQPQYNEHNQIFSVEALLRWDKAKEFNINTEDIITTIEKIGLTHELGYWVFDTACAQLEKWQKNGFSINSVSINVSAKQFQQKLFVDQVKSVIKSYNLIPSQIVIELTEAVIIDNMVSLVEKLSTLKQYGIRTSLDDFGTGYSSLAYLKHLPIDQLKIDKMFINDLTFDKSSQHIVKTIIDLAGALNIELVAEGIEMKEQFEILKNLGCQNFQGFYFSKALSGEEISNHKFLSI